MCGGGAPKPQAQKPILPTPEETAKKKDEEKKAAEDIIKKIRRGNERGGNGRSMLTGSRASGDNVTIGKQTLLGT